MAGGALGILANALLPAHAAEPAVFSLVGMGAVVAGTTHAPIQAFLIIFCFVNRSSVLRFMWVKRLISSPIKCDFAVTEPLNFGSSTRSNVLAITLIALMSRGSSRPTSPPSMYTFFPILYRFSTYSADVLILITSETQINSTVYINIMRKETSDLRERSHALL